MSNLSQDTIKILQKADRMDFEKARHRLKPVIRPTNLIRSPAFYEDSGNHVLIKPENLQYTGSFKIRGAYNKIAKMDAQSRKAGLIASSAGNHAQGVAFAARALGVPATIVMPQTVPLIKAEATQRMGATVVLHGDCYDDAYEHARHLCEKNGYVFIHPFDDYDVIEGQGTIGLEIIEQAERVDAVLIPVGGGGLIAGVAAAIKRTHPNVQIIGVEPVGAMAMKVSLQENRICDLENICTIADGVAVKRPGTITYALSRNYVDTILEVTDHDIMEAFLMLFERHKLVAENAGVLSLAGLKHLPFQERRVACIVSGGNIDVLTVASMIDRGLISRGRIFRFATDLPDKPGELVKIAQVLAQQKANIIKLEHNQFKSIERFAEVELDVIVETNGFAHIERIKQALDQNGYGFTER